MKTENEINNEIIKTTERIEQSFPELSKYINEMPVTIPNESLPEISADSLNDYNNSLKTLATNYSKNKTMKTTCIGIWMDHSNAELMEFSSGTIASTKIDSKFTHEEKKETLHKGEKAMHHKEQHEELAYYNAIADKIKKYEDVLLFGPTEAKTELLNILKADHHFDKINIKTKQVDNMTDNQKQAFVKEYFSKHLPTGL